MKYHVYMIKFWGKISLSEKNKDEYCLNECGVRLSMIKTTKITSWTALLLRYEPAFLHKLE